MHKSKGRIYRLKNSFGVSLLELSIAIGVLSVLAGVTAPIISQGIDAALLSRAQAQLLHDGRLAMNLMSEDLKNKNIYLTVASGSLEFLVYNSYPSSLYADITYYRVQYASNPNRFELRRRVTTWNSGSGSWNTPVNYTLVRDVKAFGIVGYPAVGAPGTNYGGQTPANLFPPSWGTVQCDCPSACTACTTDDFAYIQIYLSLEESPSSPNTLSFVTRVSPRRNYAYGIIIP